MTQTAFAARHSMDTAEWYTPAPFVEAAREVMGGIDLDPASHEEANRTIKATRFFSVKDDGLLQPWRGRIFLNPPGGKDQTRNNQSLVALFWKQAIKQNIEAAKADEHFELVWIGYSLEQLQTLQQLKTFPTPLDFPICIPRQRIAFIENEAKKVERMAKLAAQGKDPNKASGPSHSNYVTYIGPNSGTFRRVFERFGQVKR